jgi:mannitol/fructose-specific phosphotransferase system IIA component (Ntr-type)
MISPLLDSLLDPNHVVLDLQGNTAAEAIWEVVELLGGRGELRQPKEFFEAVMEREMKSSTVANGGVAFPHARTQLVNQLLLGIGRSNRGVRFASEPEKTVHLLFVIAVPQQMVNDYLICVGSLARRLNDEATREALLEAATAADFFLRLRET